MLLVIALPNNANKVNFAKKTSLDSNQIFRKLPCMIIAKASN